LSIELREVVCKKCGGNEFILVSLTDTLSVLECKFCSTKYEYKQLVVRVPRLIFERRGRDLFEFKLDESVLIGRESEYNYVLVKPETKNEENTYIRNPYISREHAKIEVREELVIRRVGKTEKNFAIKKCLIKDLRSSYGTAVNSSLLKPAEAKPLSHNDHIVLSPDSLMPLTIIFKET